MMKTAPLKIDCLLMMYLRCEGRGAIAVFILHHSKKAATENREP